MQRTWLAVIDSTAPATAGEDALDPDRNRMTGDETLTGLLDAFHATAAEFDRTVRQEPDLDRVLTLPSYPWVPEPIHLDRSACAAARLPGDRAPLRARGHHPRDAGRAGTTAHMIEVAARGGGVNRDAPEGAGTHGSDQGGGGTGRDGTGGDGG